MDENGSVSYHEFVAHALGGMDARGSLRSMRRELNREAKENPQKFQELIEKFREWDTNGDGFVTPAELEM